MMETDSKPSSEQQYLFVYGTLRASCRGRLFTDIEAHLTFLDYGRFNGRLYAVADYPGAIANAQPQDYVLGELYKMTNAESVLTALDVYEECALESSEPHEFKRRQVPIILHNGSTVSAWIYLYNLPVGDATLIQSGDYIQHLRDKRVTI